MDAVEYLRHEICSEPSELVFYKKDAICEFKSAKQKSWNFNHSLVYATSFHHYFPISHELRRR